MLYRQFDRKALDAAYNNTEAVGQARRCLLYTSDAADDRPRV